MNTYELVSSRYLTSKALRSTPSMRQGYPLLGMLFICIITLSIVCLSSAQAAPNDVLDTGALTEMSLEELTRVKVTSASRREENLQTAASAVFVISKRDIQRSAATTIPELLRMVPGLHVAQVNASTWAITSRGFGGVFSNKLLVLIDGRTVYTPLYSGTYWDTQDYPLSDIERIEVVRGPGGTLWGSNAVNGVINIITKKAADTQGLMASVSSGNEVFGIGNVRYGIQDDDTAARVYGRGRLIDDQVREAGTSSSDGYNSVQGGFKIDQKLGQETSLTLQGDVYSLNESERLNVPHLPPVGQKELGAQSSARGGNILAKLTTKGFGAQDQASVQFYYDRANRTELVARSAVSTYDIESQYELEEYCGHSVIFGGGVRTISDSVGVRELVSIDPLSRQYTLVNTFVQDEIEILPDLFSVTGGIKFEHNEFTGGVWQPSVRSVWNATQATSVWSSISRAVRIPSRVSNDIRVPLAILPPSDEVPLPTSVNIVGSDQMRPEAVLSYQLGARSELSNEVAVDVATFFSEFRQLSTFERATPELALLGDTPIVNQDLVTASNGRGRSWGFETVFEFTPTAHSRVQLWHTFQIVDTTVFNNSTDTFLEGEQRNNPVNQIALRGQLDLTDSWELNPMVRFVESVLEVDASAYWQADVQLAWKPSDKIRVSLSGLNLFSDQHLESRSEFVSRPATKIERSFYLSVGYTY